MTVPRAITGDTLAVVGFGRAGQSIVRYLCEIGVRVMVSDIRNYSSLGSEERELLDRCVADFEGGGHSSGFLSGADLILVSPGVDHSHPVLQKARQTGTAIIGELALAADKFKAPVIGVTGTNGKTTVTELVGAMLAASGKRVFVGGNIGTPIGDYLLSEEEYDAVVLEVSSFQLELCGDFMPEVGILLNITPDHLDRHKTVDKYAAAKMRLFQGGSARTFSVINGDDPLCRRYGAAVPADPSIEWARFGHDPEFRAALAGSQVIVDGRSRYELAGSRMGNLSGMLNSAAALLGVQPFAIEPDVLQQVINDFQPGAHRLQQVGCHGGVTYVNDSKATNTGAVNNGISQIGGAIILIAGGRDKGDDYSLMRDCVGAHVKRLVLIGEAALQIGAALGDLAPVDYPATMEEAVQLAAAAGQPGDTVLLSPACASFDMFSDYKHRGDSFIEAFRKLAGQSAEEKQL
jgi:UDP-N-acetylmuramoylalanine--D-glutamate ligase